MLTTATLELASASSASRQASLPRARDSDSDRLASRNTADTLKLLATSSRRSAASSMPAT